MADVAQIFEIARSIGGHVGAEDLLPERTRDAAEAESEGTLR